MDAFRNKLFAGWVLLFFLPQTVLLAQSSTERDPVLLISIDGFSAEYLERFHLPNLKRISDSGVRASSLVPVFPTKTFPTHYSMVTGLYPDQTGVISNNMEDRSLPGRFALRNRQAITDGRWYGGEPIWATLQRQGGSAATLFWVGSEAEIDGVRPDYWLPYRSNMSYPARIRTVMEWLALPDAERPDLITLYLNQVDITGHRYGTRSEELEQAVSEADHWIGVLLDALAEGGWEDRINLIVVSDHGMTDLSEDRLIFLDDLISLERVRVIDWTPVAMMQPVDGEDPDVLLNDIQSGLEHATVWRKGDLPEHLQFGSHPRVPELIMLAEPGYMITSRDFFERNGLIAATHGYDPVHFEMHGIFLAQGPGFKSGVSGEAFHSIQLYRLLAHLLKVRPAPNEGCLRASEWLLR